MDVETILFEPEAPGRGPNPRWFGHMYYWERTNDFPIVGRFVGVVAGVRKGADTLIVSVADVEDDEYDVFIQIRYEHLVKAVRVRSEPDE